jgi:hypothetical protein
MLFKHIEHLVGAVIDLHKCVVNASTPNPSQKLQRVKSVRVSIWKPVCNPNRVKSASMRGRICNMNNRLDIGVVPIQIPHFAQSCCHILGTIASTVCVDIANAS